MQRLAGTLESAFEQRIADVSSQLDEAKEQWDNSLTRERAERVAAVEAKAVVMERLVADMSDRIEHSVALERSLIDVSSRFEHAEVLWSATQRELDKHQAALVTLADFTDAFIKDVNVKCETVCARDAFPPDSHCFANELKELRSEFTSQLRNEASRLQQTQHLQQQTLGALRTQALELQTRVNDLQEMPDKGAMARMQYSPERTPQFGSSDVPIMRAVEAAVADINTRVARQECAQDCMQCDISRLYSTLDACAKSCSEVRSGADSRLPRHGDGR